MNTREIVLDMLLLVSSGKVFSHEIIKDGLDKYDYLEKYEKKFIKRLFEGTIERRIELDYIIGLFAKVKKNKMKPVILEVLRMGIYQVLYMNSIPESAICNEAAKLVKKKKYHQLTGFVNGVLRNVIRSKDNISYPKKENGIVEYLSVKYSMPTWIVEKWIATYGGELTETILKDLLDTRAISIRVDENISKDKYIEIEKEWQDKGVKYTKHPYLSYAYLIENIDGMLQLESFTKGVYTVQDISSMLVAQVAGVVVNDTIIDVCAAPGGKAIHMATKLNGSGKVIACDVSDAKVDRINENIARMNLANIETRVQDAKVFNKDFEDKADVLIADLPCSGLGVIGKKRDIKYNISSEQILDIVNLQKEIFANVKKYVKKGGVLIYSTCTINSLENEDMIKWICSQGEFELESLNPFLDKILHSESTQKGYLQLLPGVHQCDGFFMARLRRRR